MVGLVYGTPEEAGFDEGRIAALKDRAPDWLDGSRMRSAVLLAARRGKIVYHEALGPLTEKPDAPPLEKDSIFAIASATKPFTATAIMMLVEDGLLGLNRPIREYLPEVCGEGVDDIEVQHLLTHTSGYDWDEEEEKFEARIRQQKLLPGDPETGQHSFIASKLGVLWDMNTHYTPGSRMSYCDFNYVLLGEIVRRVSGKSLDVFAAERLFAPLGLKDTSYIADKAKADRRVLRGDDVPFGGTPGKPMSGLEGIWTSEAPWGGSGITTTALDLAGFAQMFLDGGRYMDGNSESRLLSPATIHEMTRNQIPGIKTDFFGSAETEASWGLGWMVQNDSRWRWSASTLAPKGTYSHPGAGGSVFWIDPTNEVVGVYLSVCLEEDLDRKEAFMNFDLFQNMVTAAVAD